MTSHSQELQNWNLIPRFSSVTYHNFPLLWRWSLSPLQRMHILRSFDRLTALTINQVDRINILSVSPGRMAESVRYPLDLTFYIAIKSSENSPHHNHHHQSQWNHQEISNKNELNLPSFNFSDLIVAIERAQMEWLCSHLIAANAFYETSYM